MDHERQIQGLFWWIISGLRRYQQGACEGKERESGEKEVVMRKLAKKTRRSTKNEENR